MADEPTTELSPETQAMSSDDLRRKHEAVELGGLGAIVFPDQFTAPRIARVCHGILDHVHRWRELHGDVPPRLQQLEDDAELLHLELGAAIGVKPRLTSREANLVRTAVAQGHIDPAWGDEIIAGR